MGTIHYKWLPFHSRIPEYPFLPGYSYYGRLSPDDQRPSGISPWLWDKAFYGFTFRLSYRLSRRVTFYDEASFRTLLTRLSEDVYALRVKHYR